MSCYDRGFKTDTTCLEVWVPGHGTYTCDLDQLRVAEGLSTAEMTAFLASTNQGGENGYGEDADYWWQYPRSVLAIICGWFVTDAQLDLARAADAIAEDIDAHEEHQSESYAELGMSYTCSGVNEPSAWAQRDLTEMECRAYENGTSEYHLVVAAEHVARLAGEAAPAGWSTPAALVVETHDPNDLPF